MQNWRTSWSVESLSKLRVVDLRKHLSNRGLPTSGLKAELVKRLREALESGKDGSAPDNSEPMTKDDSSGEQGEEVSSLSDDNDIKMLAAEEGKMKLEEEEQLRLEQEQAEEERLRQEQRAEEARLRFQEEKRAEEERLRLKEEEKVCLEEERAEEERLRLEEEQRAEEERSRLEEERRAEERLRLEKERRAEEERLSLEVWRAEEKSVHLDTKFKKKVMDIKDVHTIHSLYTQFMKIFKKSELTEGEKEREETAADALKEANKEETLNPMAFRKNTLDIDNEYVQEVIYVTEFLYTRYMKICKKFKLIEREREKEEMAADALKEANKEETLNPMAFRKKPVDLDDDDEDQDEDKKEEEKPKLSKRKLKKLSRMTVAELKQKVNRPE